MSLISATQNLATQSATIALLTLQARKIEKIENLKALNDEVYFHLDLMNDIRLVQNFVFLFPKNQMPRP